jgi:hypothetical protein
MFSEPDEIESPEVTNESITYIAAYVINEIPNKYVDSISLQARAFILENLPVEERNSLLIRVNKTTEKRSQKKISNYIIESKAISRELD